MLKNGERLPVKSIHKLPAGCAAKPVEVTGRLTNGRRARSSPLTQHAPPVREPAPLCLPSLPSPISQAPPRPYLGTADQRLLNISKAKSIIHKTEINARSVCPHCWESGQYLKKHFLSAQRLYHIFLTIAGFHHSKCFCGAPLSNIRYKKQQKMITHCR